MRKTRRATTTSRRARTVGAASRARADRRHDATRGRRPRRPDGRGVPRRSRRRPERWLGRPAERPEAYTWPATGPGFRPEQHRWQSPFPFAGAARSTGSACIPRRRLRRARAADDRPPPLSGLGLGEVLGRDQLRAADAHRPQPLVVAGPERRALVAPRDLPLPLRRRPRATRDHVVPRCGVGRPRDHGAAVHAEGRSRAVRGRASRAGVRGSLLGTAPTCSTAVPISSHPVRALPPSVGFKLAGLDWIGYHTHHRSRPHPAGIAFAEGSTPRELELFGCRLPDIRFGTPSSSPRPRFAVPEPRP